MSRNILKRLGIDSGLGDRLGCYLMFSMIGYINNFDVYTTWIYDNNWGRQYPSNIFDYIHFPENIKFISNDEFVKLDCQELKYRWVYHGFDYIPETIYRSLSEDGQIQCSYDEMLSYYRRACRELYYKPKLPDAIKVRPSIIHLRRGDKGSNNHHKQRLVKLLTDDKIKTICKNYVVTSDENIHIDGYDISDIIIKPDFSNDIKIRTLEEFFFYSHCKVIIQSVVELGNYGGWTGFSYVPFQLGMALYPDSPPILISLSHDNEQTRFTCARFYAKRNLTNVIMYNQLVSS